MSNLPNGGDLGGNDLGSVQRSLLRWGKPAHRPTSPAALSPSLAFRQVTKDEIHPALRLILSTSGQSAGEEQVVDFLRFAMYRGLDLTDIWIATEGGKMQWAILPVVSPGRTMLLFAPSFAPPRLHEGCIRPLIGRILEHYRGQPVDLAQVLIDPSEIEAAKVYRACGFERLAELNYLDREVHHHADVPPPAGHSWSTYSPTTHADFAATVSATYAGSLDCPSLNGRRRIEDVLAGHKASGEFDPNLWLLLRDARRPVGVLLLSRSTRSEALELVYLGVIPERRRHHLADSLMNRALFLAGEVGARRLSLAVDSTNAPALALYKRHGLARSCSRLALMRDLREPARR